MNGPIHSFFSEDHRRLDALLRQSIAIPGKVEPAPFAGFRAGVLRHIGMEEKVLFPVVRRSGSPEEVVLASRLRVDHGAIAALMVPTPAPAMVADLLSVLVPHNAREEEPAGIYGICDRLLGPGVASRMVEELRVFPDVTLNPHNDGPEVLKHVAATLDRARRQWDL